MAEKRIVSAGYLLYEYLNDEDKYVLVGVVDGVGHCINQETGKGTDEEEADRYVETGDVLYPVQMHDSIKSCRKCGKRFKPERPHFSYCRPCFDDLYYKGEPPHKCFFTKKDGEQCKNWAKFNEEFCWRHKEKEQK